MSRRLPVDIVRSSHHQIQQGDKKAPKARSRRRCRQASRPSCRTPRRSATTASTPTAADADAHAEASRGGGRPAAVAGAAAQARRPAEGAGQAGRAEAAPVPATEVTPEPQPKQEVKPDPVAETIVAEKPRPKPSSCLKTRRSPDARPQPPEAETAKAPDRKETEKPQEKQANKPKSDEKEFNADEVAALLNKEKASGGGAKRSTEEAALGGEKTTNGTKLSQSEMDCAARPGAALLEHPGRRCRRREPQGLDAVSSSTRRGAARASRKSIGWRRSSGVRTRRRRSRPPRRGALRAVQPACRQIRNLGGSHRQFRSERDVLTSPPDRY